MKDLEKLKKDFIVWQVKRSIKKVNKYLGTNYQLQTITIEPLKTNKDDYKRENRT